MSTKSQLDQIKSILKEDDNNIKAGKKRNLSDTARMQLEKHAKSLENPGVGIEKLRTTSASQNGVTLFGQLLARKERNPGESKPSSFRFQIIQTPDRNYWKGESDFGEEMRLGDVQAFVQDYEVVDCDQAAFDFDSIQDPNEMVMLMKVRGKTPGKSAFGLKPLMRYMILRNGDSMWVSIFQDKVANGVENGNYVTIRGFLVNDYENSSRPNCKTVVLCKLDKSDLDREMFDRNCEFFPRFRSEFMKIEEDVPADWTHKVSADLKRFLETKMQLCSWETRNPIGEVIKPDTAIFGPIAIIGYNYDVDTGDGSGLKRKVNQLTFQQQVTKFSDGEQKKILLIAKLNSQKCSQLLGVTDTKNFEKLATQHAKNLKFSIFAYPNHKSTLGLSINDESQKDENMRDFSHGIEFRTTGSDYLVHNLQWFLLEKALPVDFNCAKELLGGQSQLSFKCEDERNPNPYDGSAKSMLGKSFVNLSEYEGSIEAFSKDYQFRVITTDKAKDITKIMSIKDEKKRLEKCVADLLGKTAEDDVVISKHEPDSAMAVFAIHNSLVETIKADELTFSLEKYYDDIESRQEKFNPGQENQSESDDVADKNGDDNNSMDVDNSEKKQKDKKVASATKKQTKRKRDDTKSSDEEEKEEESEKEKPAKKAKKAKKETKAKKSKKDSDDEDEEEEEEEENSDDSS